MGDPLVVDYTTLRSVAECSTRTAMTSVLALQPKGTRLALEAGVGAHAALAIWLETGNVAEALNAFRGHYGPLWTAAVKAGQVSPRDEERLPPENLIRILRYWMKGHEKWPWVVEPLMTEVAVTREIGDGVVYVALIDAVVLSRTGGRWLMDHKTTSSLGPWWEEAQETSGQYVGQMWAAEASLDDVEGVVVNGLAFPRLNTSSKRCPFHSVPYVECALEHVETKVKVVPVVQWELRAYARTVKTLVKKLQRLRGSVGTPADAATLPMEGRLNGACRICDYREWCKLGRPAEERTIAKSFEVRVWNPLEEARVRGVRRGLLGTKP